MNLRVEQDLHRPSLNWESTYSWGQNVKGQLKVKLLKSNIWKSSIYVRLTWKLSSNFIVHHWIWKPTIFRSRGQRSTQGQNYKIINFNLKNNQFSSDWPELWLRLSILNFIKWTIWCIHGNRWRGGWTLQVLCSARRLSSLFVHTERECVWLPLDP